MPLPIHPQAAGDVPDTLEPPIPHRLSDPVSISLGVVHQPSFPLNKVFRDEESVKVRSPRIPAFVTPRLNLSWKAKQEGNHRLAVPRLYFSEKVKQAGGSQKLAVPRLNLSWKAEQGVGGQGLVVMTGAAQLPALTRRAENSSLQLSPRTQQLPAADLETTPPFVPRPFVHSPSAPSLLLHAATPVPVVMPLTARRSPRDVYLGPKYNVLVVDDSALTRKMLVKTLKAVGHEVAEAENGSKGIEKIEDSLLSGDGARPFDCILMDYVMPVMDGPTATKEIRALGYTAPIYGVTGNCVDSDINRFKDCGATEVFPKPFMITDFHRVINKTRAEGGAEGKK